MLQYKCVRGIYQQKNISSEIFIQNELDTISNNILQLQRNLIPNTR
jgi:hypothetical protein